MSIYDDVPSRIKAIYNSSPKQEQYYLRKILEELADKGYSETYEKIWLADYKEIPVDIDTFLDSNLYLGESTRQGSAIYPTWRGVMREIFHAGNKYEEIILSGATRIGKSSTGVNIASYMTYWLMCLRDPQKYFNKKDVSIFSILFFNVTKDLAKGVAYREYNDTLKSSQWFNEHGTFSKSERNFYYIPEGGKVAIEYGSDASHGLGRQVFLGYLDEINFSQAGVKDVNKAKKHMKDTYTTVADRIRGTFRMNGEVYGKILGISSKKSDSDFMETYVEEQLEAGAGDHMYIFSKPQWEVLPESMFQKEKFYVAVGDRYKRGFVIPDNQTFPEALRELEEQGYQIITPPIDMKSQFTADFDIALRDLAGISIPGTLSFIRQEDIERCITHTRRNPFYNDILQIGKKDTLTIEEFFHIKDLDPKCKVYPMYIHLDLSLTTDRTGISGVCITGRKDIDMDGGGKVSMPYFTHAFSVALEAPRGDKIAFNKILTFICWLRKQGINIKLISRDQFQSDYLAELLEAQGFTTSKISLDRTPDGYIAGRSILMEERVEMLDVPQLTNELIHLQRDSNTGRVDHPVGGAKDVADSFVGAMWSAMQDSPGVVVPTKSVASVIASVNGAKSSNKNNNGYTIPMLNNLYKKR